jgi:hypothetical protein
MQNTESFYLCCWIAGNSVVGYRSSAGSARDDLSHMSLFVVCAKGAVTIIMMSEAQKGSKARQCKPALHWSTQVMQPKVKRQRSILHPPRVPNKTMGYALPLREEKEFELVTQMLYIKDPKIH